MKRLLALSAALVAGCASIPDGPGVMVLPGSTKTFDQFRGDDADCRGYAHAQVGGKTPNQAVSDTTAKNAAIGTAIGAAAGGLLTGNASGVGVGAGIGLAGGALAGSEAGNTSGRGLQQRYDFAYQQCMYAKGHQVPLPRGTTLQRQSSPSAAAKTPPPPPPGTPPPPPSGYRVN